MDKKVKFTFKEPSTDPKYLSLYKWPTPKAHIVRDISEIKHNSVKGPQRSKGQEGQVKMEGLRGPSGDVGKFSARSSTRFAGPSILQVEPGVSTISELNGHSGTDDIHDGVIVPTKKQNDGENEGGSKIRKSPNRPTVILPVVNNKGGIAGVGVEVRKRDATIREQINFEKENDAKEKTPNNNALNFEQPLSDLLTNLVNHRTLQMAVDKNKSSPSEIIENSTLFFQMLEKMADVFVGMPNNILEQLSGYDIVKHNKMILMTAKFKSLLNKNIDVIETRELNNTGNAQSTDESMNDKANSLAEKRKSNTSTSVLTNNNMTTTGMSKNDVNNETKIRETDNNNDIAANCQASTSKCFFDNNDSIITVTNDNILDNDVNNETDISERDNFNVLATNYLASTSKSVSNRNDSCNKIENTRKNIYNDLAQHSLASTSKSFLINNDNKVVNNDPQTNDMSTENTTSEIHNDLIQQNLDATSKSFIDRNDDAVINHPSSNDLNNETETRERDINNDIAANILTVKKEICDDLNEDFVPRKKIYPIQDGEYIVISDSDNQSDSTKILEELSDDDSRDEIESTTVQPENICEHGDDVEPMTALDNENFDQKSPQRTRNSPPPTFDDDDDEEWKRLVNQLNGLDNDLDENETDITEEANVDNVQSNTNVLNALRTIFKFKEFKEGQEQVIRGVVEYEYDCLIIMPTGSGKSLCYQLPAVLSEGVTVVVCRLQSSIQDQVQFLKSLNIKVEHLGDKQKKAETERIYSDLKSNRPTTKLLYVTPERLYTNRYFKNILESLYARNKISRFVFDDAHCILAWAHKFRPAYVRRCFPRVPLSALSASAGARTRQDIVEQLQMQNCEVYRMSLDRPSLSYNVLEKTDTSFHDVAEMIRANYMGQSCIVYCFDDKDAEKMVKLLNNVGVTAEAYNVFMDTSVVCTTGVLGLGVDKAGVRLVVHLGLPGSLAQYNQEVGCAGRGVDARCLLYIDGRHIRAWNFRNRRDDCSSFIDNSDEELWKIVSFCQNKTKCRRLQILEYFDDLMKVECGGTRALCDNCVRKRENQNIHSE